MEHTEHFDTTSKLLLRYFWTGVAVAAVALFAAWWLGRDDRACWSDPQFEPRSGVCQGQRHHRQHVRARLAKHHEWLDRRIEVLEATLAQGNAPTAPLFKELAEEKRELRLLDKRRVELDAGGAGPAWYLLILVLTALLDFGIGYGLKRSIGSVSCLRLRRSALNWGIGLALAIFFAQCAAELRTSVFNDDKVYFDWESYCVSLPAWVAIRFFVLGMCLCAVFPLAMGYALGEPTEARRDPDPSASDGTCGIGAYISAAKWSVFLGLLAVIGGFGMVFWLTVVRGRSPESIYLLFPAVALAVVLYLVWRIVGNVMWLRQRYAAVAWQMKLAGDTRPCAPDPTVSFWEIPVKVPGAVVIAATLIIAALKYFGILPEALGQFLTAVAG